MHTADVIVVGGGLAGLTTALACARRGLTVIAIDAAHRGAASPASAAVLGPSIGRGPKGGRVGRFMFAARDRFPTFLAELREDTGLVVPTVAGALEVALNETHLAELRARARSLPDATLLGAADVAAIERVLVPVAGALHHPLDGAVDVEALRAALADAVRRSSRITLVEGTVRSMGDSGGSLALPNVTLAGGERYGAAHTVLAGGAWVGEMRGLRRPLAVRPVKGEIVVATSERAPRQVVFGAGGYLVPRAGSLLIGATSEEAGFDAEPTVAAATTLASTGRSLLRDWNPDALFAAQHSGLRPMTPDGYPILGCDPDTPALLYGCGYSRNGVLVSPLAADCIAALIVGDDPGLDLSAFAVTRFGG